MRNLTTAAATALALGILGMATPALAAPGDNYGGRNRGTYEQGPTDRNGDYGSGRGSRSDADGRGRRDRDDEYDGRREFTERDYDRYERRFEGWERGWRGGDGGRDHGYHGRHGRTLPYWLLVRRIERQGYFAVHRLRPSRWGFGWRAFARYRSDGHRVMLRIDPYTGRVLAARHL